MCDNEKLEKLQLEAAHLLTGLPSFASRKSLYFVLGTYESSASVRWDVAKSHIILR